MNHQRIKTRVVGVDISLEATTYAIVDIRGNIIAQNSFVTKYYPDINEYVTTLCERIVMLAEENGGIETIRSVGVSSPSASFVTGSIENATNMPWKGSIPLAAMMRDQLGIAVGLANDGHIAALGEHTFGSAHGLSDFIVVIIGHGLGSCIYSSGHAHLGANGYAGEVGHSCLIDHGRECGCGHLGCLEAYAAEKGILATAKEVMAESDTPSLMRDIPDLTPKIITECCEKGDQLAIEVYRRTGYYLGWGIANYASGLDPEAIVFTGGVSKAGKWLLGPAQESFEQHVFNNTRGKVRFLTSILNDHDRDVLGASVLAWTVKEYSLFK